MVYKQFRQHEAKYKVLLKWRTYSALCRILYSVNVCPFKHCAPWPPTDGGGVRCGCFLTMTPGPGGSPLVPMSLGGLPTLGCRGPVSLMSVLITVQHACCTIRVNCTARVNALRSWAFQGNPCKHGAKPPLTLGGWQGIWIDRELPRKLIHLCAIWYQPLFTLRIVVESICDWFQVRMA